MDDRPSQGQSGGVNINGSVGSVGGDIVGRDKFDAPFSAAAMDDAFRPLIEAIYAAPAAAHADAEGKVNALKREAAKGKGADDGVIARLAEGLVKLVPSAAGAVVGAFAKPVLAGVAGPVTGFVLDKLRGE